MLVIHSINPTGSFSYGESNTIELDSRGIVHLKGKNEDEIGSNGSGKSSLFNTLCVLLFGKNPTGVPDKEIPNSLWGKGMCSRCEFTSWEGTRYRITYARDWKSEFYEKDNNNELSYVGTRLFLDKFIEGIWVDFTGSSMKETREFIDYALGLSYENFLSLSYMSLRIGSRFLQGTNKDRMDILAGITGVNEWDSVLDQARQSKRKVKDVIDGIKKNISYEQGAKSVLENDYQKFSSIDFKTQLEVLNEEISGLRDQYKNEKDNLDSIQSDIDDLMLQRSASYSEDRLVDLRSKIENLTKELNLKENKIRTSRFVEDPSKEYDDYQKAEESLRNLKAEYNVYTKGSTNLLDMTNCPTCDSKISKTKKDSIIKKIKKLEKSIVEAEKTYNSCKFIYEEFIKSERSKFDESIKDLENECMKLRHLIEKNQEDINGELNTYNELNNVIMGKNVLIQESSNKLSEIKRLGDQKKYEIASVESNRDRVDQLKLDIEGKSSKIDFYEGEVREEEEKLKVYDWYISNVPYIKLHKLSVSMSELSNMVNKYLIDMGDPIRVNISSFDEKAKKKNFADIKDMLKSDIKVEVSSGEKKINTRLYSDGELSKLSNAFIRGLHDLARKFGYGCNLLMLDEVFSFIDSDNSQKLADSFRGSLDYGTTLVTDNSGIVDNLLTFDEVWVARKKNGRTKLEIEEE